MTRFGLPDRLLSGTDRETLARRLARGAFTALAINVFSLLLAVLTQMILARCLGVEGYGVFAYVWGWVNLLVVPALAGFQTAQLRYVASYQATGQWAAMRGVAAFADRLVIAAGIACGLAGGGVLWLLSPRLDPVLLSTFAVGLAMVPVLALMLARAAAVRALGGVATALAPDRLVRQFVLLVGVGGLAWLVPTALGPVTVMLVALVAAALALALVSHARARMWPPQSRAVPPAWRRREWLTTALPLLLFATVRAVNGRSSLILLGWLATTTEAGIFAIAASLAGFVAFPYAIMQFVISPTLAGLHATNERDALQRAVTSASRWVTLATVTLALPLFAFAEWFLALFGEAFVAGASVLRILLVGAVVNALSGPVGQLMNMTGLERAASVLMIARTAVTVGLSFLLISELGIIGAAIAGAFSLTFWNLTTVVLVWRWRDILSGVFGVLRR